MIFQHIMKFRILFEDNFIWILEKKSSLLLFFVVKLFCAKYFIKYST